MRIVTRLSLVVVVTLFLSSSLSANTRVETIRFHSKLLNATLRYNVILPTGYHAYFYFDCGTEDSATLIFAYNRELSALMFEKKIPHEYRELPGDHSWGYWDSQIQEILRVAARKMPRMKFAKARGV